LYNILLFNANILYSPGLNIAVPYADTSPKGAAVGIRRAVPIVILSLAVLSGPEATTLLAGGPGLAEKTASRGTFLCPDLGRTELFRSKGLAYVHTLAFAEAISAVAGGRSSFALPPVPQEWQDASSRWLMHLLTHDAGLLPQSVLLPLGEGFSSEEDPCDPQLLYKSSLEFRARPGNEAAGVAYPYYVPLAAHELERMILPHASRAERIAARIELAERLGAAECSPGLVGEAKEALGGARRVAAERHYDAVLLEPSFADAERLADSLAEGRRIAAARGVACVAGN